MPSAGMGGSGGIGGTGGSSGAGGAGGSVEDDAGQDPVDASMDAAIEDAATEDADAAEPSFCTPFAQAPCYTGPVGTEGVGSCTAGTYTCLEDGSAYGECEDQVLPALPQCGTDDFDCNGQDDGEQDSDDDGDGYARCAGDDCCDREADCDEPTLINRGAYDYSSDAIDNDCTGTANDATTCDGSLTSNSSDAADYARALDLCRTTTAAPPPAQRTWGLLSAQLERADGTGVPVAGQSSIRPDFGAIDVQGGTSMLVLSTGVAAAPGDASPSFVTTTLGTNHTTFSPAPPDWVAANDDDIPATPGCPQLTNTGTFDPIMLTLEVRVPTNARAFTVDGYFLSSDYPEWVCSVYSDYFVALLTSIHNGTPANPADRNIAAHVGASGLTPVSANLVRAGLFPQCIDGPTGCGGGATPGTTDLCVGTAELAGTGFDAASAGNCTADAIVGGGTGWIHFGGNVVPGETAYLRLAIWDNTDGLEDSHILLDNFTWLADPIAPGLQTE